ncbi:TPA: alpha-amylase [Legionella pneumophila]|nr:alpha-amylase [Legionella pneumophila]HAT9855045.1 alpha-amylase [Legionella pneumophila subsp. pneumophila]HAU1020536.1 alpha-amylase [Legionella pneumophila]HAU1058463.1 alpha-amylase [Legionella pneumophila]HAU1190025.1 alpha-amylase [Legionella pneumophila]
MIDSMGYHFLTEGNGIIACYDMYPTQFHSIKDMINYLPVLKQMGFNALWINPMQMPGDISGFFKTDKNNGVKTGNEVTRSLYAMSHPLLFNPQFSLGSSEDPMETTQRLNSEALQLFTQNARNLGIVPMFDLVLNHVAIDSPLCQDKPHWFKGVHEDFKDVRGFNYDDESIRKEIITEFWQPYIKRYMIEYGFDGVRVDAVGYVHPAVRSEIYAYIHSLAAENGKPKPVILDEALFSKRPLADEVNYLKLPGIGPTHITTEAYNVEFDLASADLPYEITLEEQLKASVVFQQKDGTWRENTKGGCINFCGNHDYRSLAMTILFQMAKKRLKSDAFYNDLMSSYQDLYFKFNTEQEKAHELKEPLKTTLLYSYVDQIKKELEDNKDETAQEFKTLVLEKLALSALTASGGWFLLSGDETCDITAKTVFQRKGAVDKSYYPQREHRIFSEKPVIAHKILEKMAEENFFIENSENKWMQELYRSLSSFPEMQKRLLVSHIDNIKHQINAGIDHVQEKFSRLLASESLNIGFTSQDFLENPRTHENGWLGLQNNFLFIKQLNTLLKTLPASLPGFSSELVRLTGKPHLIIVVRKNGNELSAPIDIVVVNLKQEKRQTLTKEDFQLIAKSYCNQYFSKNNPSVCDSLREKLYSHVLKSAANNRVHTDTSIKLNGIYLFEFKETSLNTFFTIEKEKNYSHGNEDHTALTGNTI